MKAKVSGTWREVDPKVKIGGTWRQVKRVWVKKAGTWFLDWGFTWYYTFPTSQTYDNYTLTSISGYDDSFDVIITIPSSTTFKATATGNYALRTGTFDGNTLKIINNGKIIGKGGNGGAGGSGDSGAAGAAGSGGGRTGRRCRGSASDRPAVQAAGERLAATGADACAGAAWIRRRRDAWRWRAAGRAPGAAADHAS